MKDFITMREIALMATFTALVFLSTSLFYIPLISTTGFFNIGEAFVYLAAFIGGPIVGAVAGGLGASMADMVLGYGYFAPGTLVFKGLEGFVVGLLFWSRNQVDERIRQGILAVLTLFLIGFSIFVTTPFLNGIEGSSTILIELRILDPSLMPQHIFDPAVEDSYQILTVSIPGILIVVITLLLTGAMWFIELRTGEKGHMILYCLLAGPIIIIGYFLYEIIILQLALEVALTEVPFNIAQVVFGAVIAVPIVSYLRELGIISETISLPPWKGRESPEEKIEG